MIEIANRLIGNNNEVFIIAEAGSNFGGDLGQAKELIDVAVEAGADAVKFQSYDGDSLVNKSDSAYEILNKYSLPKEWHFKLKDYCEQQGIIFCSSPFDEEKVEWLDEVDVSFYKVASGDLTYLPFIKKIAKKGKPIVLSTGMSTLGEVEEAVNTILENGNDQIILLHCVGKYPTEVKEVNLSVLNTLHQAFNLPVGFSDHTESTVIPAYAVSMGAKVIEKHFTLDRDLDTPDHSFALKPKELQEMVKNIRTAEDVKGTSIKRPTQSEKETSRISARRSIHAKSDIKSGEIITKEKIKFIRPAKGLAPKMINDILEKKAKNKIKAGEPIKLNNINW